MFDMSLRKELSGINVGDLLEILEQLDPQCKVTVNMDELCCINMTSDMSIISFNNVIVCNDYDDEDVEEMCSDNRNCVLDFTRCDVIENGNYDNAIFTPSLSRELNNETVGDLIDILYEIPRDSIVLHDTYENFYMHVEHDQSMLTFDDAELCEEYPEEDL